MKVAANPTVTPPAHEANVMPKRLTIDLERSDALSRSGGDPAVSVSIPGLVSFSTIETGLPDAYEIDVNGVTVELGLRVKST
jgi:hypothetical protein